MPGNKKSKKRKYRGPLPYKVNPLAMLRDHSTETLTMDQLLDLMIAVHSSLKAIEEGKGVKEDIIHLAVASNIALILAEAGLGPEYIPEVKEAQRFIVGLQELWNSQHRAILSGPGMLAIRRMLELHDEQMKHPDTTSARVSAAMKVIYLRMQAGHVYVPDGTEP